MARFPMKDVTRFGKCLSDPINLRIINVMREGELCSCEIEGSTGMHQSTLRSHLNKLHQAGIIRVRRRQRWMAYEIEPKFWGLIETVFEAFDHELGWDKIMARDRSELRTMMEKRIDEWCFDDPAVSKRKTELRLRKMRDRIDNISPDQQEFIRSLVNVFFETPSLSSVP